MPRVIATGGIPGGSRAAQAGAAIGGGFGQLAGGIFGENFKRRRLQKNFDPFTAAINEREEGTTAHWAT